MGRWFESSHLDQFMREPPQCLIFRLCGGFALSGSRKRAAPVAVTGAARFLYDTNGCRRVSAGYAPAAICGCIACSFLGDTSRLYEVTAVKEKYMIYANILSLKISVKRIITQIIFVKFILTEKIR